MLVSAFCTKKVFFGIWTIPVWLTTQPSVKGECVFGGLTIEYQRRSHEASTNQIVSPKYIEGFDGYK